jgi:hypothetical protein
MDYKALAIWAMSDETGASSICIARTMMGLKPYGDYPHDGGDFRRCENLLQQMPEFRERLPEMAKVNPVWAGLVARWDEIAQTPKDEQYKLISEIIEQSRKIHPDDEYTF